MWQKISRPEEVRARLGDIPIHHRYTLGVAGDRFFREMRDNKRIMASTCPKCTDAVLPPKIYCERCFEETADWRPVEGPGRVRTFTLLHRSLEEEPLEEPVAVALIGWYGVRGGLIHRLGDVESAGLSIGMEVEPAWSEVRKGSLEDLLYFRPVCSG